MSNRRAFLGTVIGGATSVAVSGSAGARQVRGANDRIRFGLIGAGGRGKEILAAALRQPNVEAVGVADIYTRRFGEAQKLAPSIKTFATTASCWKRRTSTPCLIATPQHLHAIHFVACNPRRQGRLPGKDDGLQPGPRPADAPGASDSGRVVQVGMQMNSGRGDPEGPRTGHAGARGDDHRHRDASLPQRSLRRMAPPVPPMTATPSMSTGPAFEGEATLAAV